MLESQNHYHLDTNFHSFSLYSPIKPCGLPYNIYCISYLGTINIYVEILETSDYSAQPTALYKSDCIPVFILYFNLNMNIVNYLIKLIVSFKRLFDGLQKIKN